MSKKIYLLFSFILILSSFMGCKSEAEQIVSITSQTYGTLTPIDIYKVTNGYMTAHEEEKVYPLDKKYNYYAYKYLEKKENKVYVENLLKIDYKKLKIAYGYANFFGSKIPQTYSDYWGENDMVSFISNIDFYQTYHIVVQEKSDTYKITYYDIGTKAYFNDLSTMNSYKKTIEVSKNDIVSIEYFTI